MPENKKLPELIKKDSQRSSIALVVANLVILGSIGYWYYFAINCAFASSWVQAIFWFASGTFMLWLFASHIATNCIELFINTTRLDRDSARIDAVMSATLKILGALRIQKSISIASLLVRLGQARLYQGFFDSAEGLFKESVEIAERIHGRQGSIIVAMYRLNLSSAYSWQKKYLESEFETERALEMLQRFDTPLSKDYQAYCNLSLGISRVWLEDLNGAEPYLKSALDKFEQTKPSYALPLISISQAKISCCLYLALLNLRQEKMEKLYEYINKFLELTEGDSSIIAVTHTRALNHLADEFTRRQDFTRAEDLLNMAYAIGSDRPFHPDSQETLATFETLLIATDRQAEVADMRSWLRPLNENTKPLIG